MFTAFPMRFFMRFQGEDSNRFRDAVDEKIQPVIPAADRCTVIQNCPVVPSGFDIHSVFKPFPGYDPADDIARRIYILPGAERFFPGLVEEISLAVAVSRAVPAFIIKCGVDDAWQFGGLPLIRTGRAVRDD